MKIAITGHRLYKFNFDYNSTSNTLITIKFLLEQVIKTCYPTHMISGMALGIDTIWAELAIKHKKKLIAALPCSDQQRRWHTDSIALYKYLLSNPLTEKIFISDQPYHEGCMQKRNEWMVDNCDILVAVWDGTAGGTNNCVTYAKKKNKLMIIINPKKLPTKDELQLLINCTKAKFVSQCLLKFD